ncbi:MAG: hypothetical protein HYT42_01445 [Candidatus Sungbacteria bacterium]|nr:hypothetical protein [Candidatus Sungbacteria bacterium]
MAENGKEEYAVYLPIRNRPEICAKLGPTWPSYEGAAASESAKLHGAFVVAGDRLSLRFQRYTAEARRHEVETR